MIKHLKATMRALALTGSAPLAALGHDYVLGPLKIGHPWSRPTPPGASAAIGYLTIANTGEAADRLIGGVTPAADKIEVHTMSMSGGVMRMRQLEGGLAILPGQTVTLSPGGYHLMIIRPKQAFKAGESIPATLRFEHAGSIKIQFHVEQPPAAPDASMPGRR
jgi:copper(I)-binding protein